MGERILIVGGGGREHALAWKLAQSEHVSEVIGVPGNPGFDSLPGGKGARVPGDVMDFDGLATYAKGNGVSLTVVGPENPLAEGIVDCFQKQGLRIFGPTKGAAQLESSKGYAKGIMESAGVPTARYEWFNANFLPELLSYIHDHPDGLVFKADGLAAGKGVIVCRTEHEALCASYDAFYKHRFGKAGDAIVLEERLEGEEASHIVITDGKAVVPLQTSQDHKRLNDNDEGPNTGGMGAYSPAPVIEGREAELSQRTIEPVLKVLRESTVLGSRSPEPFRGFLYAGLMMTDTGPQVLEFNVRGGDPETQPIMARLKSDLLPYLHAAIDGTLDTLPPLEWDERPAVCVVMAAPGYPDTYQKGKRISGLKEAQAIDDVVIFHAGTSRSGDGLYTNGGRVLGVTALGKDFADARDRAYAAVERISFDSGAHYRTDIAARAIHR